MHGNEEYGNSSQIFQVERGHSHALHATNRLFFAEPFFSGLFLLHVSANDRVLPGHPTG
jgi:hypothetical protein